MAIPKRKRNPAARKVKDLKKSLTEEQRFVTEEHLEKLDSDEREHHRELARMFRYLRKLRRKLERECLDGAGNRGVYALCTVISQQREVIADIRAITDLSGQVLVIEQQVLQPYTRTVGQTILNAFYQLRKLVTEVSEKKQTSFGLDTVEKIITDLSGTLQAQHDNAVLQTHNIFTAGEPIKYKVPSIKKKKRRSV